MTHSPLEHISEPMQRAGEALGRAAKHLGDFFREFASGVSIVCANYAKLLKYVNDQQEALKEAPQRVRHLAEHGKKYRTQKKNINRALREYRRRNT